MMQPVSFMAAAAAAVGIVTAQDFTGQPDCALPCLEEAIPEVGCSLPDTACQCVPARQAALLPVIMECLSTNCSPPELSQAQEAATSACASYASSVSTSYSVTGPVASISSLFDAVLSSAWQDSSVWETGSSFAEPTTVTESDTTYVMTPFPTGTGSESGEGGDDDSAASGGHVGYTAFAAAAAAALLGAVLAL